MVYPGTVRRLDRLAALFVGALLLAAPAVGASCGDTGPMAPRCPMPETAGMSAMGGAAHAGHAVEAAAPASETPCHDALPATQDCCEVRSAPEPIEALSFEGPQPLLALEAVDLRVAAPLPPTAPQRTAPAIADRLHDPGRYTLYSSFLL